MCSALPPVAGGRQRGRVQSFELCGEGEGVGGVDDETLWRRLSVDGIALRRLCAAALMVGYTADRRPTAWTHGPKCVMWWSSGIWNHVYSQSRFGFTWLYTWL